MVGPCWGRAYLGVPWRSVEPRSGPRRSAPPLWPFGSFVTALLSCWKLGTGRLLREIHEPDGGGCPLVILTSAYSNGLGLGGGCSLLSCVAFSIGRCAFAWFFCLCRWIAYGVGFWLFRVRGGFVFLGPRSPLVLVVPRSSGFLCFNL